MLRLHLIKDEVEKNNEEGDEHLNHGTQIAKQLVIPWAQTDRGV